MNQNKNTQNTPEEPQKPQWPNKPSQESTQHNVSEKGEPKKKHGINFHFSKTIVLQILAVVGVIVIIFILLNTLKSPSDSQGNKQAQEKDDLALAVGQMEPVPEGEFLYQFEDIRWIYEDNGDDTTRVNMMFEKFSRRDNVYVTFGRPYKFGSYAGICQEVETLNIDPEKETGIALAFTTCETDTDITEIALFQEWDDVVAKRRTYEKGTDAEMLPEFEPIYTITLTEVVH